MRYIFLGCIRSFIASTANHQIFIYARYQYEAILWVVCVIVINMTVDYAEQEDYINNIVSSWVSRTLYTQIIHIINRRLFWSKIHLVELNLIRVKTNAYM